MYRGARDAFFSETDSAPCGQFSPLGLGRLIAASKPFGKEGIDRALTEVRVYTGQPSSSKDPKTYAANRRQSAAWEKDGVIVRSRTLRYPRDWPKSRSQEKGIDVALAVDFVVMAVEGKYDIGVVASTDTDLLPAIEYVYSRAGVIAEVAAWWASSATPRLSVPGVWCHRLTKDDHNKAADHRDYNRP